MRLIGRRFRKKLMDMEIWQRFVKFLLHQDGAATEAVYQNFTFYERIYEKFLFFMDFSVYS